MKASMKEQGLSISPDGFLIRKNNKSSNLRNKSCSRWQAPIVKENLEKIGYEKDIKVVVYPHGSHLNGLMPNREREKKLYRMIPLIGLMYKTFGKYRKENLSYFEKSEKEIIDWIR